MKKKTKIVAGGIGAIALSVLFSKLLKKSNEEVKKEIREEKELLKSYGLKPEETYDLTVEKEDFVETLLNTLLRKTDDSINWDEVLSTRDFEHHDQTMWGSIRVMRRNEDTVSFLVHIPPYNRGEYDTLSSYKEQITEAVRDILDDTHIQWKWYYRGFYEKFDDEVKTESGKRKLVVEEITEGDSASFSDRGYADGLARLVSYFYENDGRNIEKDPNIVSVDMFVELQFNIKKHDKDMYGIDILQSIDILREIMFEVNIMDRGNEGEDVYPSIIFFPEINNFTSYYETIESSEGVLSKYKIVDFVEG
jgi:hypothetical protein